MADNGEQTGAAVRSQAAGEKNTKQRNDNKLLSDGNDRRTAIPKKGCCVS